VHTSHLHTIYRPFIYHLDTILHTIDIPLPYHFILYIIYIPFTHHFTYHWYTTSIQFYFIYHLHTVYTPFYIPLIYHFRTIYTPFTYHLRFTIPLTHHIPCGVTLGPAALGDAGRPETPGGATCGWNVFGRGTNEARRAGKGVALVEICWVFISNWWKNSRDFMRCHGDLSGTSWGFQF